MQETRHPHRHKDPRQPRDGSRPGTNPPVFVWKPPEGATAFRLQVARDETFRDCVIDLDALKEPAFLPEQALAPGAYRWRWGVGEDFAPAFRFELAPEAPVLEVPPASEWLARMPQGHPRIYTRQDDLARLRKMDTPEKTNLIAAAEKLLGGEHEIEEPPFLPDWKADYQKAFAVWYQVLHSSRRFVSEAQTLGLAYLASGDTRFARAACTRMASICSWDPLGSSHIPHNDEAHMSVIWNGPQACDFVWDQFTGEERARVIDQFRRRGQITYEHMHGKGSYGVTRFDSHAGREIVFLGMIALVFHEHIPEARAWLDWLRPVLCGIWPIWAGDDGGWAEGHSYASAYVNIMTMFASALKRGTGIDLYKRPFWQGHARWRATTLPHYAEWMGFGDHSEIWQQNLNGIAHLVELIGVETGTAAGDGYAAALRKEAEHASTPAERQQPGAHPILFLLPPAGARKIEDDRPRDRVLHLFQDVGWAAVRTDLANAERDVALIFRSSPLGSVSHSHANHNDFILHVGGRAMAMPSGYYDGYGSDHHAHWVWHTKSHNCLTLSDASQRLRSHDAVGAIEVPFEDERLAYFRGLADAAYAEAERCRRHVLFLKGPTVFVMIDEFSAREGLSCAMQWNIHSWSRFAVNEEVRSFGLERGASRLRGHFLYHANAFFSLGEGWDPPPMPIRYNEQWRMQYHLRFTASGFAKRRNLGVVLAPSHTQLKEAEVATRREGETEIARIADSQVLLNAGGGIDACGQKSDALALLQVDGACYEVCGAGIRKA